MNRFLTTHTKGASISISHHRELFQELLSTILCLPPYVVNVWMWIQSSLQVYLDCSSFPCPSDCLTDCLLHAPLRFLICPLFFPHCYTCSPPSSAFWSQESTQHPSLHLTKTFAMCHTALDPVSWALNWLLEEVGIEFRLPVMNH